MSSVLAGFLVRLGFVVDKDEQAKFQASIDYAWKAHERICYARRCLRHCVHSASLKAPRKSTAFITLRTRWAVLSGA